MVLVDLEKPIIPTLETRYGNVPEAFIDIIKDMYDDNITLVSTIVGETGEIEIKVGLHQESALSPPYFIVIMDVIT